MSIIIQKEFNTDYFDALQKENRLPEIDPRWRIIFLDIDGTLNNNTWIREHLNTPRDELIDPTAVARLNTLIEKTDAKIVVSSSWREDYLHIEGGFKKMCEWLGEFGIRDIVGITPKLKGKRRGDEIEAWLREHKVSGFVILDDDLGADVDGRQVKINPETGLMDWHIGEAMWKLSVR